MFWSFNLLFRNGYHYTKSVLKSSLVLKYEHSNWNTTCGSFVLVILDLLEQEYIKNWWQAVFVMSKSYKSRTAGSNTWCSFGLLIWKDRLSVLKKLKSNHFLKCAHPFRHGKEKCLVFQLYVLYYETKIKYTFFSFILTQVSAKKTEWLKCTLTILSL